MGEHPIDHCLFHSCQWGRIRGLSGNNNGANRDRDQAEVNGKTEYGWDEEGVKLSDKYYALPPM